MELDSDSKKKKEPQFSFNIPQIKKDCNQTEKLGFDITQNSHKKQKIEIEIKREPQKSTQDYLDILKKLNILLNSHTISEAQRRDYCKSQRYFMKLYLANVNKD